MTTLANHRLRRTTHPVLRAPSLARATGIDSQTKFDAESASTTQSFATEATVRALFVDSSHACASVRTFCVPVSPTTYRPVASFLNNTNHEQSHSSKSVTSNIAYVTRPLQSTRSRCRRANPQFVSALSTTPERPAFATQQRLRSMDSRAARVP